MLYCGAAERSSPSTFETGLPVTALPVGWPDSNRQAGGRQAGRRDPGCGEGRLLILLSKVNIQGRELGTIACCDYAWPRGLTPCKVAPHKLNWSLRSQFHQMHPRFTVRPVERRTAPPDAAHVLSDSLRSDVRRPRAFWRIASNLILTRSWLCLFAVLRPCCAVGITLSSWRNYSLASKSPCRSLREKKRAVKRLLVA